jgi:hypothetical protein
MTTMIIIDCDVASMLAKVDRIDILSKCELLYNQLSLRRAHEG